MIGAIAGDIIGSSYEGSMLKSKNFDLFSEDSRPTDDSVLTIAIAHAIATNTSYAECMTQIGRRYPTCGYGWMFLQWLSSENPKPYNSWGNGSAMRVSPVAWAFKSEEEVLHHARETARPTHNHPEGIKGAQAIAIATYLARIGSSKDEIKHRVTDITGYNLDRLLAEIRPDYKPEIGCPLSVPESIICFLESTSFEDAIRNAISLGGDADTQAAMAGAIAEAYYNGVPDDILQFCVDRLTHDMLKTSIGFVEKFLDGRYQQVFSRRIHELESQSEELTGADE